MSSRYRHRLAALAQAALAQGISEAKLEEFFEGTTLRLQSKFPPRAPAVDPQDGAPPQVASKQEPDARREERRAAREAERHAEDLRRKFDGRRATDDHKVRFCKVMGLSAPEVAASNTVQREWSSQDPVERRLRLQAFENNERLLVALELEKKMAQAAHAAELDASRKPLLQRDPNRWELDCTGKPVLVGGPVHHTPVAELQGQVQTMGFDRPMVEGQRVVAGLLDGVELREPGGVALPAPRPPRTLQDEINERSERRRREANAPPVPSLGTDQYMQQLGTKLAATADKVKRGGT